jgi:hypothetical protein
MVLLNISRSFGLRVLLFRIRTPVRILAGQGSWFYAATNVSATKTRNTTGHRRRPPEACFKTCQSPSPTPKSGCLLLVIFLPASRTPGQKKPPNQSASIPNCAPLMSGTIIKSSTFAGSRTLCIVRGGRPSRYRRSEARELL